MAKSTHNRPNIQGWFSEAQDLPDATAVDSDAMVYVGGTTNGQLMLSVFANTAVSIADTKALTINFESFTADTAASALAPYTSANSGGINQATGTALANAVVSMSYIMTASGGAMAWDAGDLILEIALPETMMRMLAHDYVQVSYTTTANESSELVDGFIWAKV